MTSRVRVQVADLWIEDGSLRPAVGDDVTYSLIFIESDDPDDDLAVEWSLEAERLGNDLVLLRGAGWGAMWQNPRPADGPLHLRGRLSVYELNLGPTASITGRIERLWVITQTIDQSGGNTNDLAKIVPGSRRLREVAISPRWFDRGHGRPAEHHPPLPEQGGHFVFAGRPPPPTPWVCETGVLIELSLGTAPAGQAG